MCSMHSDPRKKALELARKRKLQREKLLEEQRLKQQKEVERNSLQSSHKDRQQLYLEKIRKEEEGKLQKNRDQLQKSMDDLKFKAQKQKEISEQHAKKIQEENKKKHEALIYAQKKRLHEIENQKQKEIIAKKQKQEDIELEKRKEREIQYLNKQSSKQPIPSNIQKPKRTNLHTNNSQLRSGSTPFSPSDQIFGSLKNFQQKISNNNSNDQIQSQNLTIKELLASELSKEKNNNSLPAFHVVTTENFSKRLQAEQLYFETHDITSLFDPSQNSPMQTLISLWNSPIVGENKGAILNSEKPSQNFYTRKSMEIEFKKHSYWLPFVTYEQITKILYGLQSKLVISHPEDLQIVTGLPKEEISKGLIDALHYDALNISIANENTQKNQVLALKSELPWKKYFCISQFKAKINLLQKNLDYDDFIIQGFMHKEYLQEFFYGLSQKGAQYPIKSQLFEKTIGTQFPEIPSSIINKGFQNLIQICTKLKLLRVSGLKTYRNGKSRFLMGTGLLKSYLHPPKTNSHDKLPQVNSTVENSYHHDFSCPECHFPMHGSFKICPQCSTVLNRHCVVCGAEILNTWESCPYCGSHNRFFVKMN